MKFIVYILFLYLVGSFQVQTKKSNAASSKCPTPKQMARFDDGFAVQLNQSNIVYIYATKSNSFIVLNTKLSYALIFNGTRRTIFNLDTSSGFVAIFSPNTDLSYAINENQTFDLSKVLKGDFSVATKLLKYASILTDKVIDSNINTSQAGYKKITRIIYDYGSTTDYTKWSSYKNKTYYNYGLQRPNIAIIHIVNKVLSQYNNIYPAGWGAMIFYVSVTEEYKKEEECQTAFIDVPRKLGIEHNFGFTPEEMNRLFNIVFEQKNKPKEEVIQAYKAIIND